MALGTKELDPQRPFNKSEKFKKTRVRIWHLKTSIIGKKTKPKTTAWHAGAHVNDLVGKLTCLGQIQLLIRLSGGEAHTIQSLILNLNLKTQWDDLSTEGHWPAPERLYWICGTYSVLLANWSGACVLGTICLSFFLFPLAQDESLGVPVYKERDPTKKHRSLQIGDWKDDEWLSECIIQ